MTGSQSSRHMHGWMDGVCEGPEGAAFRNIEGLIALDLRSGAETGRGGRGQAPAGSSWEARAVPLAPGSNTV